MKTYTNQSFLEEKFSIPLQLTDLKVPSPYDLSPTPIESRKWTIILSGIKIINIDKKKPKNLNPNSVILLR